MNEWQSAAHASAYLERADRMPHRSAGESTLIDEISRGARRILDLGSGDGRLLDLALRARPDARGVAVDSSGVYVAGSVTEALPFPGASPPATEEENR